MSRDTFSMFVKLVNVYGDVSVTNPCGSSLRIYAETPGGDSRHLELVGMLLGCMLARWYAARLHVDSLHVSMQALCMQPDPLLPCRLGRCIQ